MVAIGLISYPLYMWHWPLLSLAQIMDGQLPSPTMRAGVVVLSFILAILTYFLVEKPLRFGSRKNIKTIVLATLTVFIGLIGYITQKNDRFKFIFEEFSKISTAINNWVYPGTMISKSINGFDYWLKESKKSDTTLFIGDSNIQQYDPRVDELITQDPHHTNSAVFMTIGGCLPIPGSKNARNVNHCPSYLNNAFELAKNSNINNIVIGALWNNPAYNMDPHRTDYYNSLLVNFSKYIKD